MQKDIEPVVFRDYGDRPQYPVESVDNALKVILMFATRKSLRLTDISRVLGVAHSTAHRLAAQLAYRGLIQRMADSKVYIPGPALREVGLGVVRSIDIRSTARPAMERLSQELGETVHLATREEGSVRFLDAVESERALRVSGRTGRLLPAHTTSVGKALLAALPPEEVRALLGDELEAVTDASMTDVAAFERQLEEVREIGYARNRGESEDEVGSIGMVIPSHGQPTAALSVAAPLSRLDNALEARAIEGLRRATRDIAQLLE